MIHNAWDACCRWFYYFQDLFGSKCETSWRLHSGKFRRKSLTTRSKTSYETICSRVYRIKCITLPEKTSLNRHVLKDVESYLSRKWWMWDVLIVKETFGVWCFASSNLWQILYPAISLSFQTSAEDELSEVWKPTGTDWCRGGAIREWFENLLVCSSEHGNSLTALTLMTCSSV